MVSSTMLAMEISLYWSFGLVCLCGVILLIIAGLALLLIKGETDASSGWKIIQGISDRRKKNPSERAKLPELQMDMHFFRIGREYCVRKERLKSNHWFSVGSGANADVTLDPEDRKLGQRHFRINISGSVLLVAALEGETFVNGVPIRKLGTVQAHSGDLIRVGSHEYRVIFAPSEEKENVT